jgi:hypothetical protein
VNVFPAEVCPYANTVPAMPAHRHRVRGAGALLCAACPSRCEYPAAIRRSGHVFCPTPARSSAGLRVSLGTARLR